MAEPKRCIGHGVREGTCRRPITSEALALNGSGLWCVECEKARREYISEQFTSIVNSFDHPAKGKGGGEG